MVAIALLVVSKYIYYQYDLYSPLKSNLSIVEQIALFRYRGETLLIVYLCIIGLWGIIAKIRSK